MYHFSFYTMNKFNIRLANVMPIHKEGRKNDPGNYRPVSLTSGPGKVMEQITLSTITRHMQNNQGIRPNQHGFIKVRSFYEQVTHQVDEGKAMDVVYLNFSSAGVRGVLTLLPSCRRRGPKRWGGMETGPCSGM